MKKTIILLILLVELLFSANKHSCRERLGLINEAELNDKINTEVFILLDESTYFDKESQKYIINNLAPLIQEKTKLNLFSFTEYSKNRKNKDLGSYYVYSDLTSDEEDDVSRSKVRKLKTCLKNAKIYAYENIKNSLSKNYRKKNDNIEKSLILRNLKIYSKNNIRFSNAKRKIVVILSDMLENSEYMSFYKGGKVKKLNIKNTLSDVKEERLYGKFNNAEIYVYGLGLVEINSEKENTRDSRVLDNLIDFWDEYFIESEGKPIKINGNELKFKDF